LRSDSKAVDCVVIRTVFYSLTGPKVVL
jgi:hypothetical protein